MINPLPPAPSPTDSVAVFDTKAFAFLAALDPWSGEVNTSASDINAVSATVQANADTTAALTLGAIMPGFAGTSTTSLTLATGAQSLTTQSGKSWVPGQVVVVHNGLGAYMKGSVTSYSGTTLNFTAASVVGSGTFASWYVAVSYANIAEAGDNKTIKSLSGLVSINGGPIGGRRNLVSNGRGMVAQRTGLISLTNAYQPSNVDRFLVGALGGTVSVGQLAQVSSAINTGSVIGNVFGPGVSPCGWTNCKFSVQHRIPRASTIQVIAKTVTASCYVVNNTGVTRNFTIELRDAAAFDDFSTSYAIGTSAPFTIPAGAGPTRIQYTTTLNGYSGERGISITVAEAALSSASSGGGLAVVGWQFEVGNVASELELTNYSEDLMLCRYFLPSLFSYGASSCEVGIAQATSASAALLPIKFDTPTRVPPTGIIPSAAGCFSVTGAGGSTYATTGVSLARASTLGATLSITGGSGLVAGNATAIQLGGYENVLFTGCEL